MSHGIMEHDQAFYGNREPAWHRLGTVIDQDVVTSGEAIRLAGLNWTVEQHPIYVHINGDNVDEYGNEPDDYTETEIHNKVANVRMDTGQALGIVTPHYQIVQNVDAFDFFDEIIGKGDAHYHTAGSLYNGRKIWALARLNRDILIGGDPDEKIDPFVALCNGHDGNTALSVYTTPIRVVCGARLHARASGSAAGRSPNMRACRSSRVCGTCLVGSRTARSPRWAASFPKPTRASACA